MSTKTLSKLELDRMVTDYGKLKRDKDELDKKIKDKGAQIIDNVGEGESYETKKYKVTVIAGRVEFRLDTATVREEMGEEWCIERSKQVEKSPSVRLTVKNT